MQHHNTLKYNLKLQLNLKMNGVCGSGTASSIDPRGSITASVSPNNKRAIAGIVGSGSVNVSGCNLQTSQGPDCMRKSRSQGGKILQKCLSTASYGEEMSLSVSFRSLTATSPCHNLLVTRKYCSFGSTTSHINNRILSLFRLCSLESPLSLCVSLTRPITYLLLRILVENNLMISNLLAKLTKGIFCPKLKEHIFNLFKERDAKALTLRKHCQG